MALPTKTPCENSAPGSVQECGAPALWSGMLASGARLECCDRCYRERDGLAAHVVRFTPRRVPEQAPAPGMFAPEADHLDWITEAQA